MVPIVVVVKKNNRKSCVKYYKNIVLKLLYVNSRFSALILNSWIRNKIILSKVLHKDCGQPTPGRVCLIWNVFFTQFFFFFFGSTTDVGQGLPVMPIIQNQQHLLPHLVFYQTLIFPSVSLSFSLLAFIQSSRYHQPRYSKKLKVQISTSSTV